MSDEAFTGSYDFAFSLGGACSCTQLLRKAGLQYQSLPLDWVRGATIDKRAELLATDVTRLLSESELVFAGRNTNGIKDIYRSRSTDLAFYHDFLMGTSLAESLPEVAAKYKRRQERFRKRMGASRRVLGVYLTSPEDASPTAVELLAAQKILAAGFPSCTFDLLVFINCSSDQAQVEQVARQIRRISLSYAKTGPNEPVWSVRFDRLIDCLRDVHVADYRTSEERCRHDAALVMDDDRKRRSLYAYLKCSGPIDFLWAKLNWKLYRHFLKVMKKRGVSL